MSTFRSLLVWLALTAVGVAGSLVVASVLGMEGSEVRHLAAFLVGAALVTVASVVVVTPMLARSSLRRRFVVVATTATVIALGNVVVLTMAMAVSAHDATLVAVLLFYAAVAGAGAAWVLARDATAALDRLTRTAQRFGRGELDVRAGRTGGGPELERLGQTFDAMATAIVSARDRDRRVEEMRKDLITAVSHDLRTPLSSLRAMIEAVDDGVVDDPDTLRRYAGEMRRSVGHLATMLDDLFELAQLDAGAIEIEERRMRLDDVVEEALETVRHAATRKNLQLVAELSGADDVDCSPRMIRVLQTLLVNAIQHTPPDGTVVIEARRSHDALRLAVEDDGIGIGDDDLQRVFEPFYRADASRPGGGAGLGLALARRIIEALGGRIDASAGRALGARFEIELPI